jgi:hypothetical protein
MTATLDDVTARKKKPEPSAQEQAAAELVRLAKAQGLSLTVRVPKTVSVQVTPHVRTHEGRRPDDHADGCRGV